MEHTFKFSVSHAADGAFEQYYLVCNVRGLPSATTLTLRGSSLAARP